MHCSTFINLSLTASTGITLAICAFSGGALISAFVPLTLFSLLCLSIFFLYMPKAKYYSIAESSAATQLNNEPPVVYFSVKKYTQSPKFNLESIHTPNRQSLLQYLEDMNYKIDDSKAIFTIHLYNVVDTRHSKPPLEKDNELAIFCRTQSGSGLVPTKPEERMFETYPLANNPGLCVMQENQLKKLCECIQKMANSQPALTDH